MNKTAFTSAFAPDLDRYLAFKGSMGFHSDYRVWYLKNFDRYCGQHSLQDLDRSTVEGWVASRLSAHPRGSRSWMSCIRDFGRWERINGKENAYVLSDQWKTSSSHAPPYLLTNEEITRIGYPCNCRDYAVCGVRQGRSSGVPVSVCGSACGVRGGTGTSFGLRWMTARLV